MPPKQQGKKVSADQKKKIVDDKTFGMKNKNKSSKIQKFVQQVEKTIDSQGKPPRGMPDEQEKRKQEKAEKEAFQRELTEIFRPVQKPKKTQQAEGADPKSIICEFFKQGLCGKGSKCKFSHDLAQERKSAKIDLYSDRRDGAAEEEGMEGWDQATLEEAVKKKDNKVQTEIICKYFLDAVESKKYGWFWHCPNGNDKCIYRHALPPGFVLRSEKKKAEEDAAADQKMLEEEIEEERARIVGHTPVTKETFLAWKAGREEKRLAKKAEADKKQTEGQKHKKPTQMSGRALFDFNPELFVDDDDAEAEYERCEEDENIVEIKEVSATGISYSVRAGAAAEETGGIAIQEALFLEGDVPDDLDDLED